MLSCAFCVFMLAFCAFMLSCTAPEDSIAGAAGRPREINTVSGPRVVTADTPAPRMEEPGLRPRGSSAHGPGGPRASRRARRAGRGSDLKSLRHNRAVVRVTGRHAPGPSAQRGRARSHGDPQESPDTARREQGSRMLWGAGATGQNHDPSPPGRPGPAHGMSARAAALVLVSESDP